MWDGVGAGWEAVLQGWEVVLRGLRWLGSRVTGLARVGNLSDGVGAGWEVG